MEELSGEIKYTRNQQHILIMQCIFQYLFYLPLPNRPTLNQIIQNATRQSVKECDKFIIDTFVLSIKHCQEAVDSLSPHLVEWEFERLNLVDQAILILGYIEMKYADIPPAVAINVCIHLAQRYSQGDSHRYINGVLDKVKNDL